MLRIESVCLRAMIAAYNLLTDVFLGLIQTANAEIQVVAHITKTRPATAKGQTTPNQVSNLSELIPELIAAIEAADGTPQDVFQAQVCLGWIHWTLSEPGLAVLRLPKDFGDSIIASLSEGGQGLTKWTEVCIVKAGYIKSEMIKRNTLRFHLTVQKPQAPLKL